LAVKTLPAASTAMPRGPVPAPVDAQATVDTPAGVILETVFAVLLAT